MEESRNPKGRQFGADQYLVVNDYFIEYVSEWITTATRLIAQKDSLTQGDAKAIKTLMDIRLFVSPESITRANLREKFIDLLLKQREYIEKTLK
ncbi:MAG: hypothetical protein E6102_02950 [Negativicoccus succinicivorans]|uniref:hypothetical protein n=1 Tax=Negativicoccus succinicivorans TaxID=620903 RepID=UPI00291516E5|nr:hypothetical protein [Negativicoccus succinicivorans]MDU5395707.1 hypothetical protein [Negativicoccus succinicivorans]